ncbi:MAG TPA: hypothetical protein VL284_13615 [Thermoanaerobaculia bacterium]|nr:hypothetical protein [Thermoanaerobaculia bacterium]
MRKLGRELAAFGLFLLLAIALTWPLAIRLSTAVSDLGDPLLNTWIINWDLYDATHHVANVYQAPIFYPAKDPLAFSENLFGIAIFGLPFYLAGLTPLAVYNILFLLGVAFCGYGAYVLVRVATGSALAGIIAGVLYAFVPFRFDHRPHIQIIWGGWLPLILAAILAYWRRASWPIAIGFGAALLMNGLTNLHYFLFGTLAAAIAIVVLAFVDRRSGWHFWLRLLVAGAIALALMIPVLLPYKTVSEVYHMTRTADEVEFFSATWSDWLHPTYWSATYGRFASPEDKFPERHLFPGLMVLFLTAAALLVGDKRERVPPALRALDVLIVLLAILSAWRAMSPKHTADVVFTALVIAIFIRLWLRRPVAWRGGLRLPIAFWIGVLWVGIGVIGSLGMHAFFHSLLYHRVSAFHGIRVPARWASIAYVGLALTAGFGASVLIRRRTMPLFTLLLVLAILDVRPRPGWEYAITDVDPVYRWLRDASYRGAVVELPVEEGWIEWQYLLSQTFHHRLLVNGTSGYDPPDDAKLRKLTSEKIWTSELTSHLQNAGASIVIVHDDWLRGAGNTAHAWLRNELASGRLVFLRRFDHRNGGDFVFAIPANCTGCAALRRTDQQPDLERMLDGEPVYLARTFGYLDSPREFTIGKRSLTISGWALSPNGIAGVDVLLNGAQRRYPATLTDRGDVQAMFPWYPNVRHAGFTLTIPKRPHGVPKYTDVQVEIVDGSGERTRLPDHVMEW